MVWLGLTAFTLLWPAMSLPSVSLPSFSSLSSVPGQIKHGLLLELCPLVEQALPSVLVDMNLVPFCKTTTTSQPLASRVDDNDAAPTPPVATLEADMLLLSNHHQLGALTAGLQDEARLARRVDSIVAILMSDAKNRLDNDKARQKRDKTYRDDLGREYVHGADRVNSHLRRFLSSLAAAQSAVDSVLADTRDYPASTKPRCGDWQCSLALLVMGSRYMADHGLLGPVVALRRRAERVLYSLEGLATAGSAMVAVEAEHMPPMAGEVCSERYLRVWADKWADKSAEYHGARAQLRAAREAVADDGDGQEDKTTNKKRDRNRNRNREKEDKKHKRLLQDVQIWHRQVELLMANFGRARVQAADLGIACAEFRPYKATVTRVLKAFKMGRTLSVGSTQRVYPGTKDLVGEVQTTFERVLDEVGEDWDGKDMKEIGLWEARLSAAGQSFLDHIGEVYL